MKGAVVKIKKNEKFVVWVSERITTYLAADKIKFTLKIMKI